MKHCGEAASMHAKKHIFCYKNNKLMGQNVKSVKDDESYIVLMKNIPLSSLSLSVMLP